MLDFPLLKNLGSCPSHLIGMSALASLFGARGYGVVQCKPHTYCTAAKPKVRLCEKLKSLLHLMGKNKIFKCKSAYLCLKICALLNEPTRNMLNYQTFSMVLNLRQLFKKPDDLACKNLLNIPNEHLQSCWYFLISLELEKIISKK